MGYYRNYEGGRSAKKLNPTEVEFFWDAKILERLRDILNDNYARKRAANGEQLWMRQHVDEIQELNYSLDGKLMEYTKKFLPICKAYDFVYVMVKALQHDMIMEAYNCFETALFDEVRVSKQIVLEQLQAEDYLEGVLAVSEKGINGRRDDFPARAEEILSGKGLQINHRALQRKVNT